MAKKKPNSKEDNSKQGNKVKEIINKVEEDDEESGKITPIYVVPTPEIQQIIEKYKEKGKTKSSLTLEAIKLYDDFYSMPPDILAILEKYKEDYGNDINIIQQALKCFDEKLSSKEIESDDDLVIRAKKERGMMLIGRTTFRQLIAAAEAPKRSIEKPQRKNNALDVILWYTKKPITALSLEEILKAIQKMWVVSNFFDRIEISKENENIYYLSFIHHEDERYSRYWLGYFEVLFNFLNESKDVPFKCKFSGQVFGQTVSITIEEIKESQ
ncbi:MAG: hypothetical protein ACP6IY_09885 [Promethearchaeia archaeon]